MSEWIFQDVDETCRELSRAEYLHNKYADNIAYFVVLSDKAIIYMETRFERKINKIVDYMAKIKNVIPFVLDLGYSIPKVSANSKTTFSQSSTISLNFYVHL